MKNINCTKTIKKETEADNEITEEKKQNKPTKNIMIKAEAIMR